MSETCAAGVFSSSSESRFAKSDDAARYQRRASRQTKLKRKGYIRSDRVRPSMLPVVRASGDPEGELERLVVVQARVAQGLIPAHEVCLDQVVSATDALSDVIVEFDAPHSGQVPSSRERQRSR